MQKTILNILLFQAAWFVTIFSAGTGHPYVGPIYTAIWMIFHFTFFAKNRFAEWNLLLFAALLGYVFDSIMVHFGVFVFPAEAMLGSPSTVWMVALWINLAATLNFSMSWLKGRLLLAALLASVAGPATYYAGSRFGAINMQASWSLYAIALQWLLAMPLLLWFSQRQTVLSTKKILLSNVGGE
jgi:hypothetical protein